jgi:hypothetical protein
VATALSWRNLSGQGAALNLRLPARSNMVISCSRDRGWVVS